MDSDTIYRFKLTLLIRSVQAAQSLPLDQRSTNFQKEVLLISLNLLLVIFSNSHNSELPSVDKACIVSKGDL